MMKTVSAKRSQLFTDYLSIDGLDEELEKQNIKKDSIEKLITYKAQIAREEFSEELDVLMVSLVLLQYKDEASQIQYHGSAHMFSSPFVSTVADFFV